MDTDLPITLTTKGLFEANDKSSGFLISKLEAWLNFKALSANWYANEAMIVKMAFTVLPEAHFMDLQVDSKDNWIPITTASLTAVYRHDLTAKQFTCFIMLSNEELNQAMKDGSKVEGNFQTKLAEAANTLAHYYHLPTI